MIYGIKEHVNSCFSTIISIKHCFHQTKSRPPSAWGFHIDLWCVFRQWSYPRDLFLWKEWVSHHFGSIATACRCVEQFSRTRLLTRTYGCVCRPVRDECFWTRHAGNHGCSSSVDKSNAAVAVLLACIVSVLPFVFWPLLCASSFLSSCLVITACSSRHTGWRRGSASSWVEPKWCTWTDWDQFSP